MYVSANELLFWQLGYAFTDALQATVGVMPLALGEKSCLVDASAKGTVVRSAAARLAVAAGTTSALIWEHDGLDAQSIPLGRLAAVGQLCLDKGCWTTLGGTLGAWTPASDDAEIRFAGGYGMSIRLSEHVGMLGEFLTVPLGSEEEDAAGSGGNILSYGVRFSGSTIGVDLAMMKPLGVEAVEETPYLIMGFPWLAFTFRWVTESG